MSYSLHPEAERELSEAAAFYQSQAGGSLASAFLNEFVRVATLLALNPEMGRPVRDGLRIHPVRRFPYALVYRVRTDGILILVVGHQHRRPNYWRGRV